MIAIMLGIIIIIAILTRNNWGHKGFLFSVGKYTQDVNVGLNYGPQPFFFCTQSI